MTAPATTPPDASVTALRPGHEALIRSYFAACSTGTAAEIAAHFTPDAIVYDTNVAPMRGAEAIGAGWVRVRGKWGATWHVEACVSEGDAAAIEWSMTGSDPSDGRRFVFRGSEHYRIESGLIAEIRQYWTFDRTRLDTGLVGFAYDDSDGAS
jgi:ketosteroid isomerase-like protein